MSIACMASVWSDPYFGQGDKVKLLVALALADYANEKGECWPSIESLAKKGRTSVRGVQEACRELERDKYLEVRHFAGRNGTNVYIFRGKQIEDPQPVHPPADSAPPRTEFTPPQTSGGKSGGKSGAGLHPIHHEPLINHQEPSLVKKGKGTIEEVKAYFQEKGWNEKDALWFFDKCEGNGWKNGGKPIVDWKATVRSWNSAGYFPSHKNGSGKTSTTDHQAASPKYGW